MSFKKLKQLFSRKHRQPDPEPEHGDHHAHEQLEDVQDVETHWSHTDVFVKEMPPQFGGASRQICDDPHGNQSHHSNRSHHGNHNTVAEPQIPLAAPFPINPFDQPPLPSHPPLEQQPSIPDEILLTVVSCLMHRQNCQIPSCPCKSVQERYRELCRQHPSNQPHQQLHLTLSSQNLTSDTHPHYHLTTKSHIRRVMPRPPLVRQRSRSCDLTPNLEFVKATDNVFYCDPTYEDYKHPLREISISADNIPALCLNDCPLPPTPLKEYRTLISSPMRSRPRRWSMQKTTLKTVKEKDTITESSESNESNTSSRSGSHENLTTVPGPRAVPGVKLLDIEQLFQEAMKRGLKRGHVMCRTLNYAVTGAAGTGKSHTVSLILNEDPPEERHSTGLLNSPIRAISSSLAVGSNFNSETPTLRRVKEGDLLDIMAVRAKQGIPNQDSPLHDEQHASKPATDEESDGKEYTNLPRTKAEQELLVKLAGGMMDAKVSSKQLGEFDLVHLLDSGGQPQFHQLLPTFVPHLDANIFVLKLCEMLDQHPTVEFYHKGQLVGSYQSFHTNQQILKHCIRAIQSQSSPDGDSTTRIAIVGTHKDQQYKCSEKLREKNKELIALLKSKFSGDNLIYYQLLQEMIFPVNAKTPDEEDREVARQLVKSITENSSSKAKPIPQQWFMLEQLLRKVAEEKGTGVLHISECQGIANKLGIRKEALGAALGYLVGLNLFLYYPQVLPKVIFSEPQAFLDKINVLVQCSHLLRGDPNLLPDELRIKLRGLCGKQWERFGYYGILTEELLMHKVFSSYYVYDNELFTPANLLELLQALLIISPINCTEFIMPCLLPDLDTEELDKHRSDLASSIAPLLVHFPNEWPQSGVFCSLVASLLSSSQWEVLQGANNEPTCLYQNCIDFQLPGPGAPGMVTLIDSFDSGYFEVHVDDDCKPLCPQIRQTIFTTLEHHIPNAPKPVIAFFCPQNGKRCKAFCHRACFICSCQYWKCSENPRVKGQLTEHQLVWLESSNPTTAATTLGDRPTLMELLKFQSQNGIINIPEEIATKYVEFSIFLLNDRNGLRARIMACKHHCDPHRINVEILQEWLTGRGKQPVTWATLVEVLQDIELSTLASDITAIKCPTRRKVTETLH